MLQLGLIEVAYDEHKHLKVTEMGKEVLKGQRRVEFTEVIIENRTTKKKESVVIPSVENTNKSLFEELRLQRLAIARAQGIAPYMVLTDKTLSVIAQEMPRTKAEFSVMYGVGEVKTEKYWRQFTAVVNKFIEKKL